MKVDDTNGIETAEMRKVQMMGRKTFKDKITKKCIGEKSPDLKISGK